MIRDYVKINEEDLKLAEDFFENDKHFNEWLINVIRYYRGKDTQIKTKIVQKYFNNYKKTMDFILNSIGMGKKGALLKAEKQAVKEATLEGVVEVPVEVSLKPNIEIVNNNNKVVIADEPPPEPKLTKKFMQPNLNEVAAYFKLKNVSGAEAEAESFIDHYTSNGWKVGKNPMKDWEAACRNWIKNKNKFSGIQTSFETSKSGVLSSDWLAKK